ncbi:hypothetical protein BC936DRAFT_141898 [Jimgerdemannia flammicorona]|uniref:Uncharacterized protein n=1 Tax=Jimgerdemannia flammicorona TaxID=994334 RepID=A0A433A1F8_9FUNG|nr:hypothetical protein BC936DRAFT_141898 [Jimgerdemannia flammicorona]
MQSDVVREGYNVNVPLLTVVTYTTRLQTNLKAETHSFMQFPPNPIEDELSTIPYMQAYANDISVGMVTAMSDDDVDVAVIKFAPFQILTLKPTLGLMWPAGADNTMGDSIRV